MRRVISTITAILVATATIAQTTIHIAPNGSDANSGTDSSPMLTLQAAIRKVVSTTAKDTAFIDVDLGREPLQEILCTMIGVVRQHIGIYTVLRTCCQQPPSKHVYVPGRSWAICGTAWFDYSLRFNKELAKALKCTFFSSGKDICAR